MSTSEYESLEKKLDRIITAIEGDARVGHRGLAKRIEVVEARTEWLYLKIAIAAGIIAAFVPFIMRKI